VSSLRGRLLVAALAALGLTIALTVGIDAFLTKQQVDRSQVAALETQADAFAQQDRSAVSYDNFIKPLGNGVLEIVQPRHVFAAYGVRNVEASGNGTTTYRGRQYIYAYRTIPARGLLLLRPASVKAAAWRPFLRGLVIAALAGVGFAVLLSLWLARSIVRPIRRVADATKALAAGEQPARLPEEGSRELASLARSFNEMADQLASARESERNFLLSVSHELKTPLTAIRGYAEGLAEGAFDGEDAAQTILLESRRLERLVRDLLDLARMNRHEFSVRREPVDLAEVARDAVARHEASAREFGVALEAVGEPSWVVADHDRLLQVASNLVENALRETPRGGSVAVEAEANRLSVSDTGPGLERDDLPRAFDRFFLYDKYGRERPVGSGLGLAIVRQLAEAMGGSVSVASVAGEGATFTVALPALAHAPVYSLGPSVPA
jgi:two-component system sensor histidine kinase BaeS